MTSGTDGVPRIHVGRVCVEALGAQRGLALSARTDQSARRGRVPALTGRGPRRATIDQRAFEDGAVVRTVGAPFPDETTIRRFLLGGRVGRRRHMGVCEDVEVSEERFGVRREVFAPERAHR